MSMPSWHWTLHPNATEIRERCKANMKRIRYDGTGKKRNPETMKKLWAGAKKWRTENPEEYRKSRELSGNKIRKEKNINWKGGISKGFKENNRLTSYAWRKIRKEVLDRDKKCHKCDKTDQLVVHHIIEWGDGGKDEIDNLITTCRACHINAHRDKVRVPKGNTPWNKGKKGLQVAWNKGLKGKNNLT